MSYDFNDHADKAASQKPPYEKNFCRVFQLPTIYPEGFCFAGGKPVTMMMVDWFNPWPDNPSIKTWEEVKALLLPFLLQKTYVKPGYRYVLVTDFGESIVFSKDRKHEEDRPCSCPVCEYHQREKKRAALRELVDEIAGKNYKALCEAVRESGTNTNAAIPTKELVHEQLEKAKGLIEEMKKEKMTIDKEAFERLYNSTFLSED